MSMKKTKRRRKARRTGPGVVAVWLLVVIAAAGMVLFVQTATTHLTTFPLGVR